jgi:hypothetical protein
MQWHQYVSFGAHPWASGKPNSSKLLVSQSQLSVPAKLCVQSQGVLWFPYPLLTGHFDEHMNFSLVAFSATSAQWLQGRPMMSMLPSLKCFTHHTLLVTMQPKWSDFKNSAIGHWRNKMSFTAILVQWFVGIFVHMCCIDVSSCR